MAKSSVILIAALMVGVTTPVSPVQAILQSQNTRQQKLEAVSTQQIADGRDRGRSWNRNGRSFDHRQENGGIADTRTKNDNVAGWKIAGGIAVSGGIARILMIAGIGMIAGAVMIAGNATMTGIGMIAGAAMIGGSMTMTGIMMIAGAVMIAGMIGIKVCQTKLIAG
ncbi:MAG: hypothetical protein HC768_14105 [Acaryochloris sp. CRU_2_0]|nr:hypothetical protein [Acaryochloris sp. CRU_2_0]